MNNRKTLRMIFPEWQGGVNPNYAFGPYILSHIAPESKSSETVEVPVDKNYKEPLKMENGYYAGKVLREQQLAAKEILTEKEPTHVVTFGGDCSVSQAAFDYLHGRYPDDLGILWIDAHPDISTPNDFSHEHAMVLGNLIGYGAPELRNIVENPFKASDVIYAGLKSKEMLDYEKKYVEELKLAHVQPEKLMISSKPLLDWISNNGIKYLAVHFDMDALTSMDFRSLLYNEPGLGPVDYATGTMTLKQVVRIINDVEQQVEVVGLTIAEYMPWDLINLRKAMESIKIFK